MNDDIERSIKNIVSKMREEDVIKDTEKPTSEVLIPGVGKYAPIPKTVQVNSEQATEAYRSISTYGEAFAQYLEREADQILSAAELYKAELYELASRVRSTADSEANRAVRYLNRIRTLAKTLDDVKAKHEEDL